MIEVRNLTKRYGDLVAIRDISFTAATGQILGFLGPNGAGKTTTMRVITGFMPATSGTVKIAGYDIFDDSYEARKRIGYLPESPPLYLDMTVLAYLPGATATGLPASSAPVSVPPSPEPDQETSSGTNGCSSEA